MPRHIFPPYLLPPREAVSLGPWRLDPDDAAVGVTEDRLTGWDHSCDLTVSVPVRVDRAAVAERCGLSPLSRFGLALRWHASGSGWREVAGVVPVTDDEDTMLSARLDGARLGGSLDLQVLLVLTEAVQPGEVSPVRPGSVLFRDARTWLLEGTGSRFPVERVDFRAAGMRHAGAAWALTVEPADPDWDATAAVRLQLNSAHPISEVLAGSTDEGSRLAQSVLRRDVLQRLITTACDMDGFEIDAQGWPVGSLGRALSLIVTSVFPELTMDDVRALRRDDPAGFESAIQGSSGFLRGEQ